MSPDGTGSQWVGGKKPAREKIGNTSKKKTHARADSLWKSSKAVQMHFTKRMQEQSTPEIKTRNPENRMKRGDKNLLKKGEKKWEFKRKLSGEASFCTEGDHVHLKQP